MNFKFSIILLILFISTSAFAQTKPALAAKIEKLSDRIVKDIHSEDVFLSTRKSKISTSDLQEIKKIVMNHGFPTISMVGKENSHKFWMMVQLCDDDIHLQVAVLKLMSRANRKGDVIKEDFAMLTDRTRMNREIPQLYGTQYMINNFGDVTLYTVYDQANINERRKTLNLSKISESEAKVKETIAKANLTPDTDVKERLPNQ